MHTSETARKKIAELESEARVLRNALPALKILDRITTRNGVSTKPTKAAKSHTVSKARDGRQRRRLSPAHKAALARGREKYFREQRKVHKAEEKAAEA